MALESMVPAVSHSGVTVALCVAVDLGVAVEFRCGCGVIPEWRVLAPGF